MLDETMNLQKTYLQFNNITVSKGESTILNNISASLTTDNKVGLVGINGSGKTTLLKALMGLEKLSSGSIQSRCTIEYVKQLDLDLYASDKLVYKYISNKIENWWDVLHLLEQVFSLKLSESQDLKSLSGGEFTMLDIAMAIVTEPDVLLLDEVTNHLDIDALNSLKYFLKDFSGAFILVSHNIDFLNSVVTEIWEVESGKLNTYGGNYDFYKSRKQEEFESSLRNYEAKKKEERKLKASIMRDRLRSERNQIKGAQMHSPGEDKFFKGFFGNRSQKKSGRNSVTQEKKLQDLEQEMKDLKPNTRKRMKLDLNFTYKKGLLMSIRNGKISVGGTNKVLLGEINLDIYRGDRIAFLGKNGSGKSSLVNGFRYQNLKYLEGDVRYGEQYKLLYVDQKYSFVKPEKTLLENIQYHNNSIAYEDIRRLLANLGFYHESHVNAKAITLSGGETARLAFAIATSAAVDGLVLDEPTNNLDVETIEIIIENLREYKGTLIVISHDISFIEQIKIENIYEIKNRKLENV